jgi:hypothetical protein
MPFMPYPGMPVYHSMLPMMSPLVGIVFGMLIVGFIGLVIGHRIHHR